MDQPMSANPPETPEEFEKRMALAQREHDRADRGRMAMFPTVTGFAVEAVKAPALVNGSAAAAMLAFAGSGRQPVTADTILGLKMFGIGFILAALATASTYVAQYSYLIQMKSAQYELFHPFVVETPASRRAGYFAAGFHVATVLLILAAYSSAGYGLLSVANSLVPLSARQ